MRQPARMETTTMNDDDEQPVVATNYLALADVLDALLAKRWDTVSLCEGWRVREVVAHLTMPARYSEDAFMAESRRDSFDFTELSNRIASRDAELRTTELSETCAARRSTAGRHPVPERRSEAPYDRK
jgi:hypothetical protein